ncbi:hypothetical protein [Paraburkholderia sp. Tr-20389]|uniref:DUF4438 family protein n=1 Tax=Paraburkholderia sp. Tr-20389 TaxID=2703903 RepID=UPI00321690A6
MRAQEGRGDYDIQLADRATRQRYRLGSLRFGAPVAITNADARQGPIYAQDRVTIGVIVHGDSTVSGHGPGVTPLLTGPSSLLKPMHGPRSNLTAIFRLRAIQAPSLQPTFIERSRRTVTSLSRQDSHLRPNVLMAFPI